MGLFSGKIGLVMGVANDHSIAWAMSELLYVEGAELAFTHLPSPSSERRVRHLVEPHAARLILPCDVQQDEAVARVFQSVRETYGRLDFLIHAVAFAPPQELRNPYLEISRAGWHLAMDISVYSLVAACRAAAPLMTDGGSIVTISYFGGEKVMPGYNVMGVCKAALEHSVRYLAWDLGRRNIRVNAIDAGPVRTLSASGIAGFDAMRQHAAQKAPWAATSIPRNWRPRASICSATFPPASPEKRFTSIAATTSSDCRYNRECVIVEGSYLGPFLGATGSASALGRRKPPHWRSQWHTQRDRPKSATISRRDAEEEGMGKSTATITVAIAVAAWVAVVVPRSADGAINRTTRGLGVVEFDKQSDYSHIRVHKQGSVRTLVFVRDHGEEAIQTMVNVKKPYELLGTYTRTMFTSYLLRPHPERVLIVGLGGGAMVHFLKHYDPDVKIDALEIDPVVVQVADRYFDIRSKDNVKIITTDGVQYLEQTKNRYDVIYMDAFLRPSADTDPTGTPLAMKTKKFYKEVRKRLTADGLVVFNVNPHEKVEADLRAIRQLFGQTYVFRTPDKNLIVLASLLTTREELPALRAAAKDLDRRFKATFSFQEILKTLAR